MNVIYLNTMITDLLGFPLSVIVNGEELDAVVSSYQETPGTLFYYVSVCNGINLHLLRTLDENGGPHWVNKYTLKRSVLTDTVGAALEQHLS